MTQIQMETGNQFCAHNILTVVKPIWRWPNKFQGTRAEQGVTVTLFDSTVVRVFIKKLCLVLKRGTQSEFPVMYDDLLWGIILKRESGVIIQNACLGKVLSDIGRRTIALFVLLWTLIKCSLKLKLESRTAPRCF